MSASVVGEWRFTGDDPCPVTDYLVDASYSVGSGPQIVFQIGLCVEIGIERRFLNGRRFSNLLNLVVKVSALHLGSCFQQVIRA